MRNSIKSLPFVCINDCIVRPGMPPRRLDRSDDVVEYLRLNVLVGMCAGWMVDRYTGEQVPGWRSNVRCDGVFAWGEDMGYYLGKYDVELPADFLAHIYSRLGADDVGA